MCSNNMVLTGKKAFIKYKNDGDMYLYMSADWGNPLFELSMHKFWHPEHNLLRIKISPCEALELIDQVLSDTNINIDDGSYIFSLPEDFKIAAPCKLSIDSRVEYGSPDYLRLKTAIECALISENDYKHINMRIQRVMPLNMFSPDTFDAADMRGSDLQDIAARTLDIYASEFAADTGAKAQPKTQPAKPNEQSNAASDTQIPLSNLIDWLNYVQGTDSGNDTEADDSAVEAAKREAVRRDAMRKPVKEQEPPSKPCKFNKDEYPICRETECSKCAYDEICNSGHVTDIWSYGGPCSDDLCVEDSGGSYDEAWYKLRAADSRKEQCSQKADSVVPCKVFTGVFVPNYYNGVTVVPGIIPIFSSGHEFKLFFPGHAPEGIYRALCHAVNKNEPVKVTVTEKNGVWDTVELQFKSYSLWCTLSCKFYNDGTLDGGMLADMSKLLNSARNYKGAPR